MSELNAIVVMCTASTEKESAEIARALVEREQAACVNIVPMIRSIYRFKGKVWNDAEQLLIIKTTRATLPDVQRTIKELHSYELPEILALPVCGGEDNVLRWIDESVRGGRDNRESS